MSLNGHAVTDRTSRSIKARKIEALLGGNLAGLNLLDLGTGSGVLADYFHERGAHVVAADRDADFYCGSLPLTMIEGTTLPFDSHRFDLVVFNHVIEHVGDVEEQKAVLAEIRRILKPGGRLYLAVPNKWALIEPHFQLPLLGALPRPIANRLVRWSGKGQGYDCYPLSLSQLVAMLGKCFSVVEDRSPEAVAWLVDNELHGLPRAWMQMVPSVILEWLRPAYPSFVMLCHD